MSFSFNYAYDYYPLFTFHPITDGNVENNPNATIKFYPVWYKQITLEWSIPPAFGDCTFNLYKSNDIAGDYVQLNEIPITTNFFKDTTTTQYSKFNHDWYILEAVLTSNSARVQFKPSTWETTRTRFVELRALEVQRREWLLLTKYTGIQSYVFKRKTYGKRCPNCWSFDLQKIVKDHCPNCMGTSFDGGYFTGINTLIQYDTNPDDLTMTYFGKFEINELSAWTISYPEINPRDIIYKATDGELYVVMDWAATVLQTIPVRQILKLVQLDRESPEYGLLTTNNLIPAQYQ